VHEEYKCVHYFPIYMTCQDWYQPVDGRHILYTYNKFFLKVRVWNHWFLWCSCDKYSSWRCAAIFTLKQRYVSRRYYDGCGNADRSLAVGVQSLLQSIYRCRAPDLAVGNYQLLPYYSFFLLYPFFKPVQA